MNRILPLLLLALLITVSAASGLEITSVAPTRATPGTRVVLTGGIFSPQSRIFLGEQLVTPAQLSPRQIEFVVPPLPPGNYSLTVQADGASAIQGYNFELLAPRPQITRIDPDTLDICTDDPARMVLVSGSNFLPGAQLLLDGKAVASRTIDPSAIEFRVPEMPAGIYGVEVHNPDGAASLPHSVWFNNVPDISGIERGSEFVNQYEVIIHGKNFFYNSILVVTEAGPLAGGPSTRQMAYHAQRGTPTATSGPTTAPAGEQLRYLDCRTLVYLRSPSNFQDRDLTLQVINPDGRKTAPHTVTLP